MSQLIKIADWTKAHTLNVVFVHGLGGHPYDTWRRGRDEKTFWPLWIADEVPGAAVFSVHYDSPVSNWLGTAMPLLDEAVNVRRRLLADPRLKEGPIAFICHSLGGLIIKQVLRDANEQRDKRENADFLNRVGLIVFLGTPHTGSDHATWLERLSFLAWPSASTRDLVRNDPGLRRLNIAYRKVAEGRGAALKHLVYFEGHPTAVGTVVPPDAGDPGVFDCEPAPIPGDHFLISRPGKRDDLVFTETRDALHQITSPPPEPGELQIYPLDPVVPDRSWGQFVPKLARLAAMILIAAGVAWLVIDTKPQAKFDAIFDQTFGNPSSALRSAHESIISVIPNNILHENGPAQWSAVSRMLERSLTTLDDAYKPIAFCLSARECKPGWKQTALCKLISAEWVGYKTTYAKLNTVAVNINTSGTDSMFGDVFGPEVRLPQPSNLLNLAASVCSIDIEAELRDMMRAQGKAAEARQAERAVKWDQGMCQGFMNLLEIAARREDPIAASGKFPSPAKCGRNENEEVVCTWRDAIAQRGRYLGVTAGGRTLGNLETIENPLNACFKARAVLAEDVRLGLDTKALRGRDPFAIRHYRMEMGGHTRDFETETEAKDTKMSFETKLTLRFRDEPPDFRGELIPGQLAP